MADLSVLFQSLFSFKTFLSFLRKLLLSRFNFKVIFCRSDETKQTLAVTLLFQCNFLLVLGADNLVTIFLIGFFRHGSGSIKFPQASAYLELVGKHFLESDE